MPLATPNASPDPLAPPLPVRPAASEHRSSGAWKVAYADFVTALMALFIVLWMMNASSAVKSSVQGYFRDPRGYTRTLGAGVAGAGEGLAVDQHSARGIQTKIEEALRQVPEFQAIRKNIVVSVTGEGLRIDLLENEQGMFFIQGNPKPTAAGEHLLEVLAGELSKMPNPMIIEGHTDARPFRNAAAQSHYGNWELAADRANAARRLLCSYGVRPDQVVEMRGFADHRLLNPQDPNDPRNRRVSVVVKFGP